jgi:hypothetical protein
MSYITEIQEAVVVVIIQCNNSATIIGATSDFVHQYYTTIVVLA